MREERRLGGGGGGHRRPPAPPTGACTSKRLPPPPRPRAPTDAAAPRSASEDGPVPGARAGRCDPVPGTRASTGGRSADPHPAARPRHARGSHAGGVRSRVTVAARAQPGSPVGACAPPTDEYRTLLTQKSLVENWTVRTAKEACLPSYLLRGHDRLVRDGERTTPLVPLGCTVEVVARWCGNTEFLSR